MRARDHERNQNWLLIKGKDEEARGPQDRNILEEQPLSVATGRSMEEIAAGKGGNTRVLVGTAGSAKPQDSSKGKRQSNQRAQKSAEAVSKGPKAKTKSTRFGAPKRS